MKKKLLDDISTQKNVKLTDLRKEILAILYEKNEPMGAYDVLEQLKKKRTNAEPPTVYRVLKFLVEEELIHRIESKNTYVCCSQLTEEKIGHKAILLLCKICQKSYEFEDAGIFLAIMKFAKKCGLKIDDSVVEMKGVCPQCHTSS